MRGWGARKQVTNSFFKYRKSCSSFYAGLLILVLAADVALAGHTQNILLTGYWPPTNEMLRKFSTDPNQNPGGWQGQNWEGRGYDIYAFFPEFPGGTGSNPKGNGDFEIDYQDVGSWQPPSAATGDFWRITGTVHPVAIMSYGQGDGPWEMEYNARNLSSWSSDYLSPTQPTPSPPDTTQSSGYVRHSTLPVDAIVEAVNSSGTGINAWIDWDGNPGAFLCEYMAYHDGWYQSLHGDPCDQYYCTAAGFTHLAAGVSPANGTTAVEAALRALISQLDSVLLQYTVSGTVTTGGSPLAGVTMCGLPGNPVTDGSGAYTAQVGGGWSGTVTPLKSGYTFNPSQRTYNNVRSNQSAQDYTALAATADTITFDAASSAGSSSAATTLSWSHTVGTGNNRILVVGVVSEDSTAADERISSVKFNGVNMTAVPNSTKSRVVYSGSSYSSTLRNDLYYMLNPPAGTYTVLITYNGSISYRVGGAITLANVKQQAPEAIITNGATAAAISTTLMVPNNGAWIVDVVGHSNSGTFTTSTATERWDKNSNYNSGACSTKAITSPGANTITWTFSGSSATMIHSMAAFAPSDSTTPTPPGKATAPAPANGATGVSVTTDLSWTAGSGATSHDVYFGTVSPGTLRGNQSGTTYDTGTMANGTTYYWRIDEKNADGTTTGDIWSFTTIYKHTLTSSSATGGDVTTPGEGAFQYDNGMVVNLVATADAHYHFVNWTGTGVTAGKVANPNSAATTITIDADYAVQANFAVNQCTITASAGDGGSIDPAGAITKDYGSSQLFTATPDTGYMVDYWMVDGNFVQAGGTTYTLSNITAPHTVSVAFTVQTFYITASTGNHGSINPCWTFGRNYGTSQLFTATPDTGYEVDKWQVDGLDVQAGGTTYILENIMADHTVYVTFKRAIFTISGYVIEPDGNTPIAGTLVSVGDVNIVTDTNGYYEFTVEYGWSGVVTPQKDGFIFEPNSDTYTGVTQNYADVNYTAELLTFVIAGRVFGPDHITPIGDVNMSAENGGGPWTSKYGGGTSKTDVNGYYEVVVDYNYTGKVTPAKYAYAFEPNSASYANVLADQPGQNYTGTLMTFRITGYIKNKCDVPIAGVLVSANNGGGQGTTNAEGLYEIWVDYAWSGTVTPDKQYHTFAPAAIDYVEVLADKSGQNYAANNVYDLDCNGLIELGDISVLAENWLAAEPDNQADLTADGIVNFQDFADFGLVW